MFRLFCLEVPNLGIESQDGLAKVAAAAAAAAISERVEFHKSMRKIVNHLKMLLCLLQTVHTQSRGGRRVHRSSNGGRPPGTCRHHDSKITGAHSRVAPPAENMKGRARASTLCSRSRTGVYTKRNDLTIFYVCAEKFCVTNTPPNLHEGSLDLQAIHQDRSFQCFLHGTYNMLSTIYAIHRLQALLEAVA